MIFRNAIIAIMVSMLIPLSESAVAQPSHQQSIATTTAVGAGHWQAIRLTNLPEGASLQIQLETDGRLRLFLVKEAEFDRLPNAARPLLASETRGHLDLTLRVPESSDYYLVLDNRQGREKRQVSVGITGSK